MLWEQPASFSKMIIDYLSGDEPICHAGGSKSSNLFLKPFFSCRTRILVALAIFAITIDLVTNFAILKWTIAVFAQAAPLFNVFFFPSFLYFIPIIIGITTAIVHRKSIAKFLANLALTGSPFPLKFSNFEV